MSIGVLLHFNAAMQQFYDFSSIICEFTGSGKKKIKGQY